MCRPPYYVTLELSVFLFDMIVFLNIVLYAFLSPSDWRTLHVGLWQTLLSIHLVTCPLLLLAELGYPFLLMERDKSWSLSTSNDNPFLITSNAVVMGPNSRHIYKGDIWQIILEKGFLRVKEPCEVTWNLGWPFPCWDVMLGCLSTMMYSWSTAEHKDRKDQAQMGLLSHWTSQPWSHFNARLFLLWKTRFIFQPVDLGCSVSDNWSYRVTLL